MRTAVFGATGQLGRQCVRQAIDAGHSVTVLARTPAKLNDEFRRRVDIVEGNALDEDDVRTTLEGTDAVLFAVGVDKHSPEDLCTDITRLVLDAMPGLGVGRFVWCGGGSTLVPGDPTDMGARFVRWFAGRFMGLRHRDKDHQLAYLLTRTDIDWFGVRPLQMRKGELTETYRLGMDDFSGMSKISFADCAHAMIGMLDDDRWRHQVPIIQY
jgi:putative NADH-flavin reductase